MREQLPDPQAFIDSYGPDAAVAFEATGLRTTLGQALAVEAMLCTAEPSRRQDPARRIGYLANILAAADSLRDEDRDLIPQSE
jgi:hypothetical protein